MWSMHNRTTRPVDGLWYSVLRGGSPATYAQVIHGWQSDPDFRTLFNATLAAAPLAAFRWETPPVTLTTTDRAFEFVLLDDPTLMRLPTSRAFAGHFGAGRDVVSFANLGGDATLVVPCPVADRSAYGHLASFVRLAPETQRHSLWRALAEAMERRLDDRPVWLSTAGAGVPWLHVRLDDQPKYYRCEAFRRPPG